MTGPIAHREGRPLVVEGEDEHHGELDGGGGEDVGGDLVRAVSDLALDDDRLVVLGDERQHPEGGRDVVGPPEEEAAHEDVFLRLLPPREHAAEGSVPYDSYECNTKSEQAEVSTQGW